MISPAALLRGPLAGRELRSPEWDIFIRRKWDIYIRR
jgi:hypothetical protein